MVRTLHVHLALVILACHAIVANAAAGSVSSDSAITVAALKGYERQVELLVDKALPCTVCVRAANGQGSGSGVVVSQSGVVLTAAHVLMATGNDLVVVFPDGREVNAKPLGSNRSRDAGMIQILDEGKYPFVELGDSSSLKTNQWCVALGHAGGFDPRRTPPIRLGRILSNDRFVMTDSALIGGDSGGPLFDLEGRLIGIHSNIGASLSQNNHVPVNVFREDWDRLKEGDTWGALPGSRPSPNRPMLGIQLNMEYDKPGALIDGVVPGSPAAKAGLQSGDVVEELDGRDVPTAQQLIDWLGSKRVGTEVKLKVTRDEETLEVTSRLIRARDLSAPSDEPEESNSDAEDSSSENSKGPVRAKGGDQRREGDDELDMAELMRRARENGGRLELTPRELRQLQRQMAGGVGPPATELRVTDEIRQWGERVFAAYEPVVAQARRSVLPVVVRGKQVALATVVGADGLLVTKASEIIGKDFEVALEDGHRVPGRRVRVFEEFDLATIRVDVAELTPVEWDAGDHWKLGAFVAVASDQKQPEAIGVVSVLPRGLDASQQGFLGVVPETADGGVRLMLVQQGSPAAAAGLRVGDLVLSLNGANHKSPGAFAKAISLFAPGDEVSLKVRRDGEELEVKVELGDRASLAPMPGQLGGMMNRLGGPLSRRRTGFRQAVQHDSPLDPEDCGGPLVDLDGKVIGINIARAGRIMSYAVPAKTVQELLAR